MLKCACLYYSIRHFGRDTPIRVYGSSETSSSEDSSLRQIIQVTSTREGKQTAKDDTIPRKTKQKPFSDYPSLPVLLRADEALCDLAHPALPHLWQVLFICHLLPVMKLFELFKYYYLFSFSEPPDVLQRISPFPIVSIDHRLALPPNQFQLAFSLFLQYLLLLIICLIPVCLTGSVCMLCKQMPFPDKWFSNQWMINLRIF